MWWDCIAWCAYAAHFIKILRPLPVWNVSASVQLMMKAEVIQEHAGNFHVCDLPIKVVVKFSQGLSSVQHRADK
jgi:hypothetical protein